MSQTKNEPRVGDLEFVNTRLFHTTRERLFQAWINPDYLKLWWGPRGFTNTFEVFDPRPGGDWRFVMHGPDGKNYPNHSVFVEITRPERIVFDHQGWPLFRVEATFAEEAGGTRLTFRMIFKVAAEFESLKTMIPEKNEENFDRLEAQLARMP